MGRRSPTGNALVPTGDGLVPEGGDAQQQGMASFLVGETFPNRKWPRPHRGWPRPRRMRRVREGDGLVPAGWLFRRWVATPSPRNSSLPLRMDGGSGETRTRRPGHPSPPDQDGALTGRYTAGRHTRRTRDKKNLHPPEADLDATALEVVSSLGAGCMREEPVAELGRVE